MRKYLVFLVILGGPAATILKDLEIEVLSPSECRRFYDRSAASITNHMICAGKKGDSVCTVSCDIVYKYKLTS